MCTINNCTFIVVQNLERQLEETYDGMKFNVHTEQPISIVDSKVVLLIPEKTRLGDHSKQMTYCCKTII